jgi:CYTH domain-containing protein
MAEGSGRHPLPPGLSGRGRRENEGLVITEVEMADENQTIEIPEWAGREISLDPKYLIVNLMTCPSCRWSREMKLR